MSASRNPGQSPLPEDTPPPLTYMDDHQWLEEVGVAIVDEPWLIAANKLTPVGSVHLRTTAGRANREAIVQARSRFFGKLLSWDEETNPIHRPYSNYASHHPELLKPSVAVTAMRLLSQTGYNPSEVVIETGLQILTTRDKSKVVRQLRNHAYTLRLRSDFGEENF